MYQGKIIDCHVHVGDFDKLRQDIQNLLKVNSTERDFDVKEIFSNPEVLGNYLLKNGIAHALLLGEDGPATNFHITSDYVCDFRNRASLKYKNLFTCIGSLNPNRESNIIKKYYDDKLKGIKGYKLYPCDHNFNPLTESIMELYKLMEKDKMLLMFHTGESAQVDCIEKYQNPKDLEIIVQKFPYLKIIFCHGGKLKYAKEMARMLDIYPNLYMDTGFVSSEILQKMFPDLKKYVNKIIFASDLPGGVNQLGKFIEEYRQLSLQDEEVEKILYSNMKEILEYMEVL